MTGNMSAKIGAVILAAGGSTRFGAPKQLLDLNGTPMLQVVVDLVASIRFEKVALVLGANRAEIEAKLKLDSKITIVNNPLWQQGQGSSVALGVQAIEKGCDAIIFFLGDQPYITRGLVEREIAVYTENTPDILVPVFNGIRSNPVIFGRTCFEDLKQIEGDQGGRAIFPKHQISEMYWPNTNENRDIDARNDL